MQTNDVKFAQVPVISVEYMYMCTCSFHEYVGLRSGHIDTLIVLRDKRCESLMYVYLYLSMSFKILQQSIHYCINTKQLHYLIYDFLLWPSLFEIFW